MVYIWPISGARLQQLLYHPVTPPQQGQGTWKRGEDPWAEIANIILTSTQST